MSDFGRPDLQFCRNEQCFTLVRASDRDGRCPSCQNAAALNDLRRKQGESGADRRQRQQRESDA